MNLQLSGPNIYTTRICAFHFGIGMFSAEKAVSQQLMKSENTEVVLVDPVNTLRRIVNSP